MDSTINSLKKGETHYYQLYCKCPKCCENGSNVPPLFWEHEGCGGDIYIGENACFYCNLCEKEVNLTNVTYKCPICDNVSNGSINFSPDAFGGSCLSSVSFAAQMVRYFGIEFLKNLLKKL